MRTKTKRRVARYWGYILLIALFIGWFFVHIDPIILGVLSLLIVIYTLFQAPVPCCAKTRDYEYCRNNASGLLRGCHLEAHKWQNIRIIAGGHGWSRFARGTLRRASGNAAAISALAGTTSAISAVVTLLIK